MVWKSNKLERGIKSPFLLFFFLILSASLVTAVSITEEYEYIGYNDYIQAGGKFNDNLNNPLNDVAGEDGTDGFSDGINIPQGVPLVADLDGDGRNEIIVQNGAGITLYQNKTLEILIGLGLNFTPTSNIVIFDIDNDGRKEIILGSISSQIVSILEYNSSGSFGVQRAIGVSTTGFTTLDELMVACAGTENCNAVVTGKFTSGTTRGRATAMFFNSTSQGASSIILDGTAVAGATGSQTMCFPQIRGIETKNFDGDGVTEYIMSFIEGSVSFSEKGHIVYWSATPTISVDLHISIDDDVPFPLTGVGQVAGTTATVACSGGLGNFITPPLVFDATNDRSNMETAIGFSTDANEYRIDLWDYMGVHYDDYPEGDDANGVLLSNVFRANALDNDGQADFCVLGGSPTDSDIKLTCGSAVHQVFCISFVTCQSAVFDSSFAEPIPYNVSRAYGSQHIIAHATQHSNNQVNDGQNDFDADEIVTSYGIYRLLYGGDNTLDQIFAQPYGDASVIMADVQKSGFADMLVLTNNSLWYIDDRFENTGARNVNITYNPCIIDTVVKQNTTIQVTVRANDEESEAEEEIDQVSTQVIGYFGDINQQIQPWSANATAMTPRTFTFTANSTISTGIIRIESVDTGSPTSPDVDTQSFTVGVNGVEFGSGTCTTSFALESATPATPTITAFGTNLGNNSITNGITFFKDFSGLGTDILWYILMLVLAVVVWTQGAHDHPAMTFGVIVFAEAFMFVIGAMLGIIGIGTVIVMSIVGLAILGLLVARPILFGGGQ